MSIKDKIFQILNQEFREYSEWTKTTAIYDSREKAITCCLLGLGGESVELSQHMFYESGNEDLIKKEFGDILWYVGHLVHVLGVQEKIQFFTQNESFDEIFYYIGPLQESFKKVVRDDNFVVTDEKLGKIVSHINELLSCIYEMVEASGFDFLEILELNKVKLESRLDRGVISGSGDNR